MGCHVLLLLEVPIDTSMTLNRCTKLWPPRLPDIAILMRQPWASGDARTRVIPASRNDRRMGSSPGCTCVKTSLRAALPVVAATRLRNRARESRDGMSIRSVSSPSAIQPQFAEPNRSEKPATWTPGASCSRCGSGGAVAAGLSVASPEVAGRANGAGIKRAS